MLCNAKISGSPSWNFYYRPISRGIKSSGTKMSIDRCLSYENNLIDYQTELMLCRDSGSQHKEGRWKDLKNTELNGKSLCSHLFKKWSTFKVMHA